MLFWWICGGESVLPVLLLRHLGSSQAVHLKGDQSWVFIGRSDVEAETPILWPPHERVDSLEKTLMLGGIGATTDVFHLSLHWSHLFISINYISLIWLIVANYFIIWSYNELASQSPPVGHLGLQWEQGHNENPELSLCMWKYLASTHIWLLLDFIKMSSVSLWI